MALFALLLLAAAVTSAAGAAQCTPLSALPISSLCANAPVDTVSPGAYLGIWYQIFVNPGARAFSASNCVTARYSARGPNITVLNCQMNPRLTRPECVNAVASVRPGAGSPSRLNVDFGPRAPLGDYNIAALLGDPEYGYSAAAVFSCNRAAGKLRTVWFFLARNPYRPYQTLWDLQHKLKCKGYDVYNEQLTITKQGKGCKYFYQPPGFDIGRRPGRRLPMAL